MTHTPGPWEHKKLTVDGEIITRFGTFEITTPNYDVCAYLPGGGPIRKLEDARLIAAAPDLYEACLGITKWIVSDPVVGKLVEWQEMEKLFIAIAKAEGTWIPTRKPSEK